MLRFFSKLSLGVVQLFVAGNSVNAVVYGAYKMLLPLIHFLWFHVPHEAQWSVKFERPSVVWLYHLPFLT